MNNITSVFILINFLIFIFIDNKFGFYISFDGDTIDYDYAKNGQGNIVAVIKDGVIITVYFYDSDFCSYIDSMDIELVLDSSITVGKLKQIV